MIKKLKNLYFQEQFNPRFIGLFINPFYFARKGLYRGISELIVQLDGRVLDIGCGHKPYAHLSHAREYIGLELDTPTNRIHKKADYFYDGAHMPFANQNFDNLISNQVFEHVFNPNDFLKEANRVLKMDGKFLITVPFVWDEHEQPYDYARYSSFGLEYLLCENGFEIMEHRKSNNGLEVIFQLINAYLFKITLTKKIYVNLGITLILMAPINLLGLLLAKILPRNDDLYLDNIVLAKKIKDV